MTTPSLHFAWMCTQCPDLVYWACKQLVRVSSSIIVNFNRCHSVGWKRQCDKVPGALGDHCTFGHDSGCARPRFDHSTHSQIVKYWPFLKQPCFVQNWICRRARFAACSCSCSIIVILLLQCAHPRTNYIIPILYRYQRQIEFRFLVVYRFLSGLATTRYLWRRGK